MPEQMDISEDELDNEDAEKEGGDEKAKQQYERSTAETQAAIASLTRAVQDFGKKVEGQSKQEIAERQNETDKATAILLANGYKPGQLEALVTMMAAAKADIRAEIENDYKKDKQVQVKQTLDQQCYSRAEEELIKALGEDHEWLKKSTRKQALLTEIWETMDNDKSFGDARKAYSEGRTPSRGDFAKAARLVSQTVPKGAGMNSKDNNSNQLDTRNSRPGAHPAIDKNGEVDVSKLNDYEREVYTTTLNTIGKSAEAKKIALHALRTIGAAGR